MKAFVYTYILLIMAFMLTGCGGDAELSSSTDLIAENSAVGTRVGEITVSNAGDSAVSSIVLSGAGNANFKVDNQGIITVAPDASLDYETKRVYNLQAVATNTSGSSVTGDVVISISDVADVLALLSSFSASIDENIDIGTLVGKISVLSSGDTAISSFTISDSTNFEINAHGEIRTRSLLDFTVVPVYNLSAFATNSAGNSLSISITINLIEIVKRDTKLIPTLVVVMNWNDHFETEASIWSNKIFDNTVNPANTSVNSWYKEVTDSKIEFVPVTETSGLANDGVIMVEMNKNHTGNIDNARFRDEEIAAAIVNAEVVDNMDFAILDTDGDGSLSSHELQIIFIVAGGEGSYGDSLSSSIWAHAWSFNADSTLSVDGVKVMRYTANPATTGRYARFGANHGGHKATVGIIVHELGHSTLFLGDYYDDGGGSGLGVYDVMSSGSWSRKLSDSYQGETPTQFSAYNKIDTKLPIKMIDVKTSQEINIKCSSTEIIKLVTNKPNEFFLIECRDTSRESTDSSFQTSDSRFSNNDLFMMMYHVDTNKLYNREDGVQTEANHYKVSLVEKDESTLMTSTESISVNYEDVYFVGDIINDSQTQLYSEPTGYSVEVLSQDLGDRTMTLSIINNLID